MLRQYIVLFRKDGSKTKKYIHVELVPPPNYPMLEQIPQQVKDIAWMEFRDKVSDTSSWYLSSIWVRVTA